MKQHLTFNFPALIKISSVICFGFLSVACVTIGEYQTVLLEEQFESGSGRISVKAPVRRYRDSFYNVGLGPYQVVNTEVGKGSVSERSQAPVRKTTEDDTLWNLIFNQDLKTEKVTYEQFRVDQRGDFSFSVVTTDGATVDSDCQRHSIFLENEEVSRYSIGIGNVSDDNVVERYGEWLATRLSCSVSNGDDVWLIEATTSQESVPLVTLTSRNDVWDTRLLKQSLANEPGVGGRNPMDEFEISEGADITGVALSQSDMQIAAVSMVPGNSAIWLDAGLTDADRIMMIATGYSLILNDWLTE